MESKFSKCFKYDKIKYCDVVTYFENMIKYDFIEQIEDMGNDRGRGSEASGYTFPSIFDGDDDDEEYFDNGVLFYEFENEIIISFEMFVECVQLAANIYLEENDVSEEDKKMITESITKIKERYNVK